MKDKICLITGANSGIGKATAIALSQMGAHLIVVCRNQAKAETARQEIKAAGGIGTIDCLWADLSSLKQIRQLADSVNQNYPRIDVLINNAGAMFSDRRVSEDGFELTFAVNHLAYFMLTNLIMDKLLAAPAARVVSVSSMIHYYAKFDINDLGSEKKPYKGFAVYGLSKLCNVMFTTELARRLKGTRVTANCLHPGVVASNFADGMGFPKFLTSLYNFFIISPEKGAATSIYLAASEEAGQFTGRYFDKKKPKQLKYPSEDPILCKELWEASAKMCGIQPVI